MKRLYFLSLIICLATASWAQHFGTITINKTDQSKETYDIENVAFMKYTADGKQQLHLLPDHQTIASTLSVDDIKSIVYQVDHEAVLNNTMRGFDNSRWFDYQRMLFCTEMMAGNFYQGSSPFLTLTTTANDMNLAGAAASLNGIGGNLSTAYYATHQEEAISLIDRLTNVPESKRQEAKGEIMLWEALAMFYQVRLFGAVPLTSDPAGVVIDYANMKNKRIAVSSLYNYIIKTLEKAITLLPERAANVGDLDQYCAKALLAKVYLTRAGFDEQKVRYEGSSILTTPHERNAEDLQKAAQLSLDVIKNSGRSLMANYSDIFKGRNNRNSEALISWRWVVGQNWTYQNLLQCDLAPSGFSDFSDCWGEWNGVSLDLQQAFGEDVNSATRTSKDARRKATMMMEGDFYDYLYTEFGGFDLNKFLANGYENHYSQGMVSPTKAYSAKHLYGTIHDHEQAGMGTPGNMVNGLYTHVLRLADVYLIYCEAVMGNNNSTTDATALDCFYQVRHRGLSDYQRPAAITWDDVWKERRLELALEGDRWFDFVRLFYYDPARAISEVSSINRKAINGNDLYANATQSSFTMPYPNSSELRVAAAYSPRLADIEGFAPQPANPVTITAVSPQPARFGEPLVLTGTNLDKVTYVTIPHFGKITLPSTDVTVTPTTLTINALPKCTHPGEIELGVKDFAWPAFVTITVTEPKISSVTPNPANAGEQLTITGTNLELVDSISIPCYDAEGNETISVIRQFAEHTSTKIVLTVPEMVHNWFDYMTLWVANDSYISLSVDFVQTTKIVIFNTSKKLTIGKEGTVRGMNMDRIKHLYIGTTEIQFQLLNENNISFTVPEMEPGTYNYVFEAEDGSRITGPDVTIEAPKAEIDVSTAFYTETGQAVFPLSIGSWNVNLYLRRNCVPAIEQLNLTPGESRLVIYKEKGQTGQVLAFPGDWSYYVLGADWNGGEEMVEIVLDQTLVNYIKGTSFNGWDETALVLQGEGFTISRITIQP